MFQIGKEEAFTADENLRYEKDNILAIPDLSVKRHYESEGIVPIGELPQEEPHKPDRYVETLDDLDRVYRLADLLPSDLATIIRNITEVLSLDTQGKIILQFKEGGPPPSPGEPEPSTPPPEEGPTSPPWNEPTSVTPGEYDTKDKKDVEIDDIFSREPAFTIDIERGRSLVDIARAAYKQDDCDIKEHYTSMMTQITNRFFQIMTTLAEESNMEDYVYLMQDFDGTAVTTSDSNQRHLIDTICKGQIIYDQKLRQMNLTHTAANALCMTRGFHVAEKQRERYFEEQYKKELKDMPSTFSNDLLEASRSEATKKYKQAAYNQYKFLDNAVKDTNTLLNIKIDEASAKAQLSNTGSDIFAFTPPPSPTENHIDDNYDATQSAQKKAQDAINNAQKDAITGAQAAAGGGTSAPGSSSVSYNSSAHGTGDSGLSGTTLCSVGGGAGKGVEYIYSTPQWAVDMCVRCSQQCGIPADWLWCQWVVESGWFSADSCVSRHNYGCCMDENQELLSFSSPEEWADWFAVYIRKWNNPASTAAKTPEDYFYNIQHQNDGYVYCASNQEGYGAKCMSILEKGHTVLT